MNIAVVKALPKVELHCHLDGSISPVALTTIIERQQGVVPENLETLMRAPVLCASLKEYLQPFSYILQWLQTQEALTLTAYDVVAQAATEGVIYLELRFAPMLHCRNGLRCKQVVEAVIQGMSNAMQVFSVKVGLILCLMRGGTPSHNQLVVETAREFRNSGVIGVDLAGSEADYPPELYTSIFRMAYDKGLFVTIHAGENGPAEYVETAISMGASRIGHGVAIKDSPKLLKLCAKKNIMLELCPTSNIQTGAVCSLMEYPICLFLDEGIPVSVNTDNRSVSHTNLTREYMLFADRGLDYEKIKQLNVMAVNHAFLSKTEKELLLGSILSGYANVSKNA